jgi:hypothetical protein
MSRRTYRCWIWGLGETKMKLSEIVSDIDAICKQFRIENYSVNQKTGRLDVDGDVYLDSQNFIFFPIKFGVIKGDFYCRDLHNLESLEGAPTEVTGDFSCSNCLKLTSLKGAPTKVGGYFKCNVCTSLTSLEGAPTIVKGSFGCSNCENLTKLSHIKSTETLFINDTPITNLLYVFKIEGLKEIETGNNKLDEIINKHLAGDRDIMDCQEELIEAGFRKYARLK